VNSAKESWQESCAGMTDDELDAALVAASRAEANARQDAIGFRGEQRRRLVVKLAPGDWVSQGHYHTWHAVKSVQDEDVTTMCGRKRFAVGKRREPDNGKAGHTCDVCKRKLG
jgi:hypothetical protein